MAYEAVKQYLEERGLADRITVHKTTSDTVEHAAALIGCRPEEIAKTMGFLLDDTAILIVTSGDAKIANAKYKERFGKKAKMIPWDAVEDTTGHEPGGVCPFALKDGVKVYLDRSLLRFETVYAAAGTANSTVRVTPAELEKLFGKDAWVDVCNLPE
ncbi:MAG: YbaK/EbsC family protein [Clostridia bacterium]|nr:YbaK/EbsC family protein [Clostridia bacterium]